MLFKSKKKSFRKFIHQKMSNNSYIGKLVNDLTNLLNESDHYDMEIEVGENDNIKIFKTHSNILKSRSSYFKAALSGGWVKRAENGVILFEKKNISPKIFEVLLMYVLIHKK